MWFFKLIRQFFFAIDQVVYNFIPAVYDLLISIARTSVLTQSDILEMADRIYKLLAVFMIFKVTFSLIMYVVNPDDFSDKSKGISKLGTNIVISLTLLILTPYIFNLAYQFQSMVLSDNSLMMIIFGDNDSEENFFGTAGEKISYITMSPFFVPNSSLHGLYNCAELTIMDANNTVVVNPNCTGLDSDLNPTGDDSTLYSLTENNSNFSVTQLKNYITGINNKSLGLMFRSDIAIATTKDNKNFIIDYKIIFSTVVGIVVVLLLITFCMDVAVRSIKLAFLQLAAPIPIISYVDPKSGKDGLFKKWYQMCFKTYLSLFIRLIALYFAIYIISKVADMKMVDIVDGSYVSNGFISIFIIIGALMFAKQLPKILEGLGIKLDGDGKFTLNPLKKFEEGAIGGKRITGMAGGMAAGLIGGHGVAGRVGSLFTGAARGFAANKGYKGGLDRQADVNRKLREARINGAGFWRSRSAILSNRYGLDNYDLESRSTKFHNDKNKVKQKRNEVDSEIKAKEREKKELQNKIYPEKAKAQKKEKVASKAKGLIDFSVKEINTGKAGVVSNKKAYLEAVHARLEQNQGYVLKKGEKITYYENDGGKLVAKTIEGDEKGSVKITEDMASKAKQVIGLYENKLGAIEHLEVRLQGEKGYKPVLNSSGTDFVYEEEKDESGKVIGSHIKFEKMSDSDNQKYQLDHRDFTEELYAYTKAAEENGEDKYYNAKEIKNQKDNLDNDVKHINTDISSDEDKISDIDNEIRKIQVETKVEVSGFDKPVSIEQAEQWLKEEENDIEEEKKRREENRTRIKNSRIGGS